jgi:hypothetical protein
MPSGEADKTEIAEREPKVISVGLCHVGGFYLGVLV